MLYLALLFEAILNIDVTWPSHFAARMQLTTGSSIQPHHGCRACSCEFRWPVGGA